MVRKSRGRDIRAACGQLIVESERKSSGQALAARLLGEQRSKENMKDMKKSAF
jgi:hypothetical protein